MFTIIEGETSAWMLIPAEDELSVYRREESGDWSQLSLESTDDIDRDKAVMLEELYSQQAEQEQDFEEGEQDEDEDASAEEDDEEPAAEEEDSEEEAEPAPRGRAAASKGRSRSSS